MFRKWSTALDLLFRTSSSTTGSEPGVVSPDRDHGTVIGNERRLTGMPRAGSSIHNPFRGGTTMRNKVWNVRFAIAVILLLGCSRAHGQEAGSISGRVLDPQGAAVPNVNVRLGQPATGTTRVTVTTAEGLYSFPSLPVGSY